MTNHIFANSRNKRCLTPLILLFFGIAFADGFDPFAQGSDAVISADTWNSNPVIPEIQFENDDISMAFQIISDTAGLSILPSHTAGQAKVSLWAKNISAKQLLDTVVMLAGLVHHKQGNIISIMTYDEYMQYYGLEKNVVVLENADADAIAVAIKPFLTKVGKIVVHTQTASVVIYDTKANLTIILDVVKKLDTPGRDSVIELIDLEYADAEILAEKLKEVFAVKQNQSDTTAVVEDVVGIYSIGRTNQMIIEGRLSDVKKVKDLVVRLDSFSEPATRNYHISFNDAAEVYDGLERIIGSRSRGGSGQKNSAKLALLEKSNSILLTGPPSSHRIMQSILTDIDVKQPYETGLIRVYKIDNADVQQIADVISTLLQTKEDETDNTQMPRYSANEKIAADIPANSNTPADTEKYIYKIAPRVAVNQSTNSVIVQASAGVHRELEKLIEQLDKRRKQVLIKAMIVEVITNDDFELGVELNSAGTDGLAFTSFGLSTIDPVSGVRDIIVSPGGTAAVLMPNKIQAIIKAIKSDSNARVVSSPQILVNDNAVGFTNSIEEEPITQVNASETVATTSFAGFVEAGTQFAITPHISEENYLRIEYEIILNSFGAKSTDSTIPPPRNTTSIKSEATVPNGATIIVGGLQSTNQSKSVDKVPLIGDVPLIGELFKSRSTKKSYKTTYLFITPIIMQDDNFDDLKRSSKDAMEQVKNDEQTFNTHSSSGL